MDIIIKQVPANTNNLYQILVYDSNFCNTSVLEGVFFETEEMAEKYGKDRYADNDEYGFVGVIMKNGKKVPDGDYILYGDANRPGDIFVCPVEFEPVLLDWMNEEGKCQFKCKERWFPNDYSFGFIKPHENIKDEYKPFDIEWDD